LFFYFYTMIISIYTTWPNKETCKQAVQILLKEKLIACANLISCNSIYTWKGAMEEKQEVIAWLKTNKHQWDSLKAKIIEIHPYDTPCVIKFEVEANEEYSKWILQNTSVDHNGN
ncbi:MAG: divalent-cation tolerance protein CutA, partial [Bacteroidota bacterium]